MKIVEAKCDNMACLAVRFWAGNAMLADILLKRCENEGIQRLTGKVLKSNDRPIRKEMRSLLYSNRQ